MSGSRITIAAESWLDNVHPGDILREDFLIDSDIALTDVAQGSGIDVVVLRELIAGRRDVDAAIDARLTRYFGTSIGYFLRLQNGFDMEEVLRREGDALDRIVPRAA